MSNKAMPLPFLKWAGGKRWLWKKYPELFAVQKCRYVEPFLGGASIFFALNPKKAILSDLNIDLIETYSAICDDWSIVWEKLQRHHRNHTIIDQYYYKIRLSRPRSMAGRAAKFIYLNRTCFNGLYRVNLRGEFNVPKGTKDTVVFPDDDFRNIANRLKSATIMCADFEVVINAALAGDFLFVDPPYTVKHNLNGFLKYNERIFSWGDQERLADSIRRFAMRGGCALVTNAAHQSVIDLYADMGEIHTTQRHSILSSETTRRNEVEEIAITIGYKVKRK